MNRLNMIFSSHGLRIGLLMLVVLSLCSVTQAATPRYSMDCSTPLYIPTNAGTAVTNILLGKGISSLIPVLSGDSVPYGAIILASVQVSVSHQDKYFGPARWREFTCEVSVVFGQNIGAKYAYIYVHRAEGKENQLSDSDKVDPCEKGIRKVLSGFTCKKQSFNIDEDGDRN